MDEKQVNQDLLFKLTEKYENLKDQLKSVQIELEAVMTNLGTNTYHQDPVTLAVYKIYVPEGTFISFKKIDYKRTSFLGEKGGVVLSKSEAQENGFVLK